MILLPHFTYALVSPAGSLPGTLAIAVHSRQAFDKGCLLRIIGFGPRPRYNFSPVISLFSREL
jgi:hypothetical protein